MRFRHIVSTIGALSCLWGCDSLTQINRDMLRYNTAVRGTESYWISQPVHDAPSGPGTSTSSRMDSLRAGVARSASEIRFYEAYLNLYSQWVDPSTKPVLGKNTQLAKNGETLLTSLLFGTENESPPNRSRTEPVATIGQQLPDTGHAVNQQNEEEEPTPIDLLTKPAGHKKTNDDPLIPTSIQKLKMRTSVQSLPTDRPVDSPNSRTRSENSGNRNSVNIVHIDDVKQLRVETRAESADRNRRTVVERFLPKDMVNESQTQTINITYNKDGKTPKSKTITTTLNDDIARSISSISSISQMRDLLTEPGFPRLLPMKRDVTLTCLAPAENVVFQSMSALQAAFKKGGYAELSLTAESKNEAFLAIRETQKTWFLQNAMFRLCEMAVNAPSGFRNIYPIIIHDIVRRTAEMAEQDLASIAKQVQAEQQTKQEALKKEALEIVKETKEIEKKIVEDQIKFIAAQEAFVKAKTDAVKAEAAAQRDLAEAKCLSAFAEKAEGDEEIAKLKARCEKLNDA